MEEIKACMNDIIKKVIKKENNRKWREKNPNYDYNRYWKDPELSRKKDREYRKAYKLKYA